MKHKIAKTVTRSREALWKRQSSKGMVTRRGQSKPPEALARFIDLVNAEWPLYRPLPSLPSILPAENNSEIVVGRDSKDESVDLSTSSKGHLLKAGTGKYKMRVRRSAQDEMLTIDVMREMLATDLQTDEIAVLSNTKMCEERLVEFSTMTLEYLGSPSNIEVFIDRYRTLQSARAIFLCLSRLNGRLRKGLPNEGAYRPRKLLSLELSSAVTANLKINDRSELEVSQNPIIDALKGVPITRIRGCLVCGKVFWASRTNSECCNLRCRKTYNQRSRRQIWSVRKRRKGLSSG